MKKTEGVVLIDELDLHLHPKWQRHVIEDLRTTFPKIQFIFTSHSPFLIQSLRSSEELIMLDGSITLASHLSPRQSVMARNTLRLVGLDKPIQIYTDSNNEQVALDRVAQRMEIFGVAREALSLMLSAPNSDPLKRSITMNALANGFFSIWMTVFDSYPDMKLRFIQAFDGTANSGCFDIITSGNVSPAPNPDNLSNGGKI